MDNAFISQITGGRIESVEFGREGSFIIVSDLYCAA